MINHQLEHIKRRFGIIGNHKALHRAIEIAMQVAPTDMNVLITGENGSGKESFSKIIHYLSPYKHKKLIPINCGSIPEGTIDSELFGHEKGAFTGAIEKRKGHFEEAHGGTIFLDEIGELPLSTQTKLLRVLEYGEFMKVGSSKVEKSHARIIAATNVDLVQALAKGTFREDLYYRLNTVPIHIPPLRKREKDTLLLFKKFAGDFADTHHTKPIQLTPEAEKTLIQYAFPGNIRQLKNLVKQMSVLEYKKHIITHQTLTNYLPSQTQNLVALEPDNQTENAKISEREILYKVLFDMQKDLQDLKRLLFEHLKKDTVGTQLIKTYPALFSRLTEHAQPQTNLPKINHTNITEITDQKEPKIIPVKLLKTANTTTQEEENLLLANKEKELILKALKKHNYKRKYAAQSLGIAERTLYRKIKEYNL